jgi:hypothetical protein
MSHKERDLRLKEKEERIRGSSELKKWIPLIGVADQIYNFTFSESRDSVTPGGIVLASSPHFPRSNGSMHIMIRAGVTCSTR